MQNNQSQYSLLPAKNSSILQAAEDILSFYPVLKTCLEAIDNLPDIIEYGFLQENDIIVQQGEKGYDIFLICDQKVDVVVHEQLLYSMEGPVVIGEKAIVAPDNIRAATICVTPQHTCFVLKIPLGKFLQNIHDKSIQDTDFTLQAHLFSNFFTRIQKRLLDNISIQKNLWEQVNNTATLLNIQLISKAITAKKIQPWSFPLQESIAAYLKQYFNINWKTVTTIDSENLHTVLLQLLNKLHPASKYKLEPEQYKAKIKLIWNDWITKIATHIVAHMESDLLPISLQDIQLFNPANYHLTLKNTLSNIESTLISKNESSKAEENPLSQFLKPSAQGDLWLDIFSYFNFLDTNYTLIENKRFKADTAQKLTLVASKYENEFNMSIARMRDFLKKIQGLSFDFSSINKSEQRKTKLNKALSIIYRFWHNYNAFNYNTQNAKTHHNEFYYEVGVYPRFIDLLNISAGHMKSVLHTAFAILNQEYNLSLNFNIEDLQRYLYVVFLNKQQQVPFTECKRHLWIPLSENITFHHVTETFPHISRGRLLSTVGWDNEIYTNDSHINESNNAQNYAFTVQDADEILPLAFFIPFEELPWMRSVNPPLDVFNDEYLPLMQWIIGKYIQYIEELNSQLERLNYHKSTIEVSTLQETWIKQFETQALTLTNDTFNAIKQMLKKIFKVNLPANTSSSVISKQLYNQFTVITEQTMTSSSNEEKSNHSYTLWRQALSDIIKLIAKIDSSVFNSTTVTHETPILINLKNELTNLFQQYNIDIKNMIFTTHQDHTEIIINLKGALALLRDSSKNRLDFFNKLLSALSANTQEMLLSLNQTHQEIETLKTAQENEEEQQKMRDLKIKIAVLRNNLQEL